MGEKNNITVEDDDRNITSRNIENSSNIANNSNNTKAKDDSNKGDSYGYYKILRSAYWSKPSWLHKECGYSKIAD